MISRAEKKQQLELLELRLYKAKKALQEWQDKSKAIYKQNHCNAYWFIGVWFLWLPLSWIVFGIACIFVHDKETAGLVSAVVANLYSFVAFIIAMYAIVKQDFFSKFMYCKSAQARKKKEIQELKREIGRLKRALYS